MQLLELKIQVAVAVAVVVLLPDKTQLQARVALE
jgi:hypothetical protein